jgi:hypothetical protein
VARIDSNLDDILNAVVTRLIDQLSDASSSNCYVSDDPDSLPPNPGDWVYVVSPSPSGRFSELFEGGGVNQAEVITVIVVTIHSTSQNDEAGRADNFFRQADRGLLPKTRLAFKALAGHDLQDGSANELLNEPMHPADYTWLRPDRSRGSNQLGFQIKFDMDLTT